MLIINKHWPLAIPPRYRQVGWEFCSRCGGWLGRSGVDFGEWQRGNLRWGAGGEQRAETRAAQQPGTGRQLRGQGGGDGEKLFWIGPEIWNTGECPLSLKRPPGATGVGKKRSTFKEKRKLKFLHANTFSHLSCDQSVQKYGKCVLRGSSPQDPTYFWGRIIFFLGARGEKFPAGNRSPSHRFG